MEGSKEGRAGDEPPPKYRHPGEALREASFAASEVFVRSQAATSMAVFHAHFPRCSARSGVTNWR